MSNSASRESSSDPAESFSAFYTGGLSRSTSPESAFSASRVVGGGGGHPREGVSSRLARGLSINGITMRKRAAIPRVAAVNGHVARFFTNTASNPSRTITGMMANYFTVKAEHLTTLLGLMTWLVASSTGLHLALVLYTEKILTKTKV